MPVQTVVECPHARSCGACALLGVQLNEQLKEKRAILRDEIGQHEELDGLEPMFTLPSPQQEGYRNRAKMAFDAEAKDGAALGYFRPRSRFVVDAPDCKVLVPEILQTTRSLRTLLRGRRGAPEGLRFVDVRCGSDPRRQHLTLVLGDREARMPLAALRDACPHVEGIGINVNPGSGAQVIKGHVLPAWGDEFVRFELPHETTLVVSAGSFFQVNLPMLGLVHERMREFLGEGDVLADLYAGVGTHGIALRHGFRRVICVEGVRASVRDAKASIQASRASNVGVMASPVERSMARLYHERPDAVVMNPSREGALPEVINAIASSPATRVAYLSCDPRTLARDLVEFVEHGFDIASVEPLDMMPQTLQVEALALLERRAPEPPRPRRRQR